MLKRKHISVIILCAYVAAVAVLCFMKGDNIPSMEFSILGIPSDKIAHFMMFVPFPFLTYFTFRTADKIFRKDLTVLLVSLLAGAGFAAGTERIQSMLEYRSGDIMDLAADMTGLLFGCIITIIYMIIIYRK